MLKYFFLLILFYSCEKEIMDNSTQASQDNLTAESIFNDIGYIVEEGFRNNEPSTSYPTYTFMNSADTSGIDTLEIDFGPTNYLHNGKYRRGKIHTTYTGGYYDPLSLTISTFDNYYVNNNLVIGERIITNEGINNNGNMWFTININDGRINTSNGLINWESNRIREWTNGQNTYSNKADDEYKITGTARGNSVNGDDFTVTITTPLTLSLNCLDSSSCMIQSGSAIVSPYGRVDRTIKYGSLCDCNVNVVINENT